MKLTVVFFENPKAMHEIENWEKTKTGEIIAKDIDGDNTVFIMAEETVFCTPVDKPDLKTIYQMLNSDTFIYNKTLIFGKVISKQLIHLTAAVNNFEAF